MCKFNSFFLVVGSFSREFVGSNLLRGWVVTVALFGVGKVARLNLVYFHEILSLTLINARGAWSADGVAGRLCVKVYP